jgi:pyridoxamine 5'-phosphate oxidase
MSRIADLRKEYMRETLSEHDVDRDPFQQFGKWWTEALESGIEEANAMTLATATPEGLPTARIVLIKGYDRNGFVFFTNYESRKGKELLENPHACLLFFWSALERQVRIEGICEKVSEEESDNYFHSRPEGSRIGAWVSPQSQVIGGREVLDEKLNEITAQYSDGAIPRPPHWGGYVVVPRVIEFWQGRPSRLHDRIRYSLDASGTWKIERLAP